MDINDIELPYTERKEIRNYIIQQIPEQCLPAIQLTEKIQKNFPNREQIQNEIIATEKIRQTLNSNLMQLKHKKCDLLKSCVDLKLSSYLKDELQKTLDTYDIKIGTVLRRPIDGLIQYHILNK